MMMMMIIIMLIINNNNNDDDDNNVNNLICIVQCDTSGTLTALYIVMKYIQTHYAPMDIHETIIFIHVYMSTHINIHRHMYK